MMRDYGKFVLAATFVGALAGCSNKDEAPPPQLAPPTEASRPAQTEPKLAVEDLEQSSMEARAPFVLTLDTPADYDKPGEIEVKARIDAPHGIDAPTAIGVTMPKGVELVQGQDREQLADLPGGVTVRTFRFKLTKGLTKSHPIKVSVHMQHPGGAFGAHAERSFPETALPGTVKISKPANVPAPPLGRPGGGLKAATGKRSAPGN